MFRLAPADVLFSCLVLDSFADRVKVCLYFYIAAFSSTGPRRTFLKYLASKSPPWR